MRLTREQRLRAARLALEGLSVGDALGREGRPDSTERPWRYSDDTEMATAILEVLRAHERIHQDALAAAFARRFERDPERGYGAVAYWQLHQLTRGGDWRTLSTEVFRGQGSLGNGAAMRAAPIGAYFADDLEEAARQAQWSAVITHAHPDGQAGAIAVAIAAAYAHARRSVEETGEHAADRMFEAVLGRTPESPTRDGLVFAASLTDVDASAAARVLGDGTLIRSSDTVPFAVWCAAHHLDSYDAAMRAALSGCHEPTADRDTICAIVGSIVVLSTGLASIPPEWLAAREPLDPDLE